jgi:hypothetical protein
MTFLNPFALIGLITAAIPLILHLLNLRKLRTIEFSTLTFLKELQQTKIRKLKLKQLLLLIIRTLMIIFIVLTFSRPALQGTILGGIGSHAYSTVIIILDDSFSMSAQDENGELFKQAKSSAEKILELLKDGDEAYIIKLSKPEVVEPIPSHNFQMLKTSIVESQLSLIRNPMEPALRLSAKIISQSKNANKEIYLISDFQRSLFVDQIKQTVSKFSMFDIENKFFLIDIGTKIIQNTSIDSLHIDTQILEKNKPVTFNATIKNYSDKQLKNFVASLYLDGARVSQFSLDLEPWGTSQITLTATPKISGFIKGFLEIENDAIEQDNKRYFTIYIPERLKTVIISSTSDDSRFIKLALRAGTSENQDSLFDISEVRPERLSTINLKKADALIAMSINNLPITDIDRIKTYVEQGGGIIIFPDKDFSKTQYDVFLSKLNISPVESVLKTSADAGLSFQKIDFDHPIFSGMFKELKKSSEKNLESPNIFMTIKRQAGKVEHPIITMSDGSPFLTDQKLGNGRILFYSAAPVLSWSNFPLKGIFAPLIYRSLMYVSAGQDAQPPFYVGREAVIKLKSPLLNQSKLKLILPDATEEILQSNAEIPSLNQADLLSLGIPLQSGIYALNNGNKNIALISSNVDRMESDTRKLSNDELTIYWKKFGVNPTSVKNLAPNDKLHESILASRYGVELWKYAIVLVLILALIEMFVASDRKEKAFQQ